MDHDQSLRDALIANLEPLSCSALLSQSSFFSGGSPRWQVRQWVPVAADLNRRTYFRSTNFGFEGVARGSVGLLFARLECVPLRSLEVIVGGQLLTHRGRSPYTRIAPDLGIQKLLRPGMTYAASHPCWRALLPVRASASAPLPAVHDRSCRYGLMRPSHVHFIQLDRLFSSADRSEIRACVNLNVRMEQRAASLTCAKPVVSGAKVKGS